MEDTSTTSSTTRRLRGSNNRLQQAVITRCSSGFPAAPSPSRDSSRTTRQGHPSFAPMSTQTVCLRTRFRPRTAESCDGPMCYLSERLSSPSSPTNLQQRLWSSSRTPPTAASKAPASTYLKLWRTTAPCLGRRRSNGYYMHSATPRAARSRTVGWAPSTKSTRRFSTRATRRASSTRSTTPTTSATIPKATTKDNSRDASRTAPGRPSTPPRTHGSSASGWQWPPITPGPAAPGLQHRSRVTAREAQRSRRRRRSAVSRKTNRLHRLQREPLDLYPSPPSTPSA